jgi:hypothetical protein
MSDHPDHIAKLILIRAAMAANDAERGRCRRPARRLLGRRSGGGQGALAQRRTGGQKNGNPPAA